MVRGVVGPRRAEYAEWDESCESSGGEFRHVVVWRYAGPPPKFLPATWDMTVGWLRVLGVAQAEGRSLRPIPGHEEGPKPGRPRTRPQASR